jgi:hypothetical protein
VPLAPRSTSASTPSDADMPPSRLVVAWTSTNPGPLIRSFAQIAATVYRQARTPE